MRPAGSRGANRYLMSTMAPKKKAEPGKVDSFSTWHWKLFGNVLIFIFCTTTSVQVKITTEEKPKGVGNASGSVCLTFTPTFTHCH